MIKGAYGGLCNVTACQKPGATNYNQSTRKHYCDECAHRLNTDSVNRREAMKLYGGPLVYPAVSDRGYRLFVDSDSSAQPYRPEDYIFAKSVDEAIEVMAMRGCPDYLSISAGEDSTRFLVWMIQHDVRSKYVWIPGMFRFRVHGGEHAYEFRGTFENYLNERFEYLSKENPDLAEPERYAVVYRGVGELESEPSKI